MQETLGGDTSKARVSSQEDAIQVPEERTAEDKGSRRGTERSDGSGTMGRLGRSGCGGWWLSAESDLCTVGCSEESRDDP